MRDELRKSRGRGESWTRMLAVFLLKLQMFKGYILDRNSALQETDKAAVGRW